MWAVILDVFGSLLAGLGIYLLVAEGEVMGIPAAELRGPGIGMLVVGIMLMVPLVAAITRRIKASR